MILHNTLGIFMCEQQFGPAIQLSTGKLIPTRWVGEQHVEEDFGRSKIPTVGHCWQSVPPYQGEVIASYDHALWSAQAFSGSVLDYLPVHQWLDQARAFFPDQRSDLMLHNTFGLELAEQRFGPHITLADITMNGRPLKVPVRDVVTLHIRTDLGKDIPTLETCLLSMKKEMWMGRGARALSDEVEELTYVS